MSLPEECEIYSESVDPLTGKIRFEVENKVITLVSPASKKNVLLQPQNQILQSKVATFRDPLIGKLKNDFNDHQEERVEEEIIQKEIETTINIANNLQVSNSLSFRTSVYNSTNNYSLNTFLSEDVSLNSNMIS
jgi:DNA-binding ferritin-like protein (Dps family)